MDSNQIIIIATIAIYLIGMIVIGIMFSKKTSTSEDFYLGGRKMGPLVTAMSAEASDMSSWLLMGLPGVAYLSGMADAAWTAIGLAVGTWLNWYFVSKRLRRYSANLGAITVPEFFSKRFHDKNNILSTIAALAIIVFFVPYTASGFAACGKLFSTLFGADYFIVMIISASVIVGYTILGGFGAVSTTDFIQSIVMTIALGIVLCYGVVQAGGMQAVIDNAKALPGYLSLTEMHDMASGGSTPYGALTIISTAAWGLGYFGMPHILLRFMAIKDENKLKTSRRVASVWVIIAMGVALFIGIVGFGMTKNGTLADLTASASDSEKVIINIAGLISQNGFFAALVGGLILAGILASTMSTADSQMLAAASSVSENIVQGTFGAKLSKKKSLLIARITIVAVAIIAVFLARDPDSSVFQIVSFAWAGFGGAFGALVLCALFWKRTNKWGALAGMLGGAAMVFIWKFAIKPLGGVWGIYELLPAFLVSLVLIIVVSLLTKAPDKSIIKEFEAAKVK